MLNSTLKRLAALENALSEKAITLVGWKSTDCPHEAAQQYRDIISRGACTVIDTGRRISSDEAEQTYKEIMG